jgi:hypothetical protein
VNFPARPAAGPAGGALAGSYPSPGISALAAYVGGFMDDFRAFTSETDAGDLHWTRTESEPGAVDVTAEAPTASTERGIVRVATTNINANVYGAIHLPHDGTPPHYRAPPIGWDWTTKIRISGTSTSSYAAWSGLASDPSLGPGGANICSFVGMRALSIVGAVNWFAVVRDGTTESTLDTGIAADGTWRKFYIRRTSSGFQVYSVDMSVTGLIDTPLLGTIADTNAPTVPLYHVALGVSQGAAVRSAEIDIYAEGGFVAR